MVCYKKTFPEDFFMKLMIASDIHGDATRAREVLEIYEREGAQKLILLGDLLYFGPRNTLTERYDPQGVIRLLNENKEKILCVRGNCDAEVDQMVLDFPIMAEYAYLCIDGHSMLLTHGHKINKEASNMLSKGEILIHGHTHVLCIESFGVGNLYLNPGSTTYPKENNPPSYMIYENGAFEIKHLDSGEVIKKIDLRKEF
jgi:putative phosphoesterase